MNCYYCGFELVQAQKQNVVVKDAKDEDKKAAKVSASCANNTCPEFGRVVYI